MRVSRLGLCMVFAVVVSLAGCASAFMAGSSPSAAPPSSMATYRIAACANSAGQVVAGPAATYYLTNETDPYSTCFCSRNQGEGKASLAINTASRPAFN